MPKMWSLWFSVGLLLVVTSLWMKGCWHLTLHWNFFRDWCGVCSCILKQPRLRQCIPQCPVWPQFLFLHAMYNNWASVVVVCWEWTSQTLKHVGFTHCQQCILISAHVLIKFLNLQVIGSSDDRKVHYFFYSHIHNKFALAILGFQWLWVCYLCSYVWIHHFQQIAKFLFCADRFVLGLCNKHALKSHPVGGRSLEWCYDQFGQFCCSWIWASSSSSSCLCVTSNSASIFSCHIRRLCTLLVANTTQLNGAPLLTVVFVVFFPFSFLFPQEIWYMWPSCPSSIVSPTEQIHHDLFSFPLLVK